MQRKIARTVALTLALLLAPAVALAQGPPAPQSNMPPEAERLIAQLEQLQSRIAPAERQALSDPALRAEQGAIGAEIETAMAASDPTIPRQIERLDSLMAQARTGTVAGDDRINALVGEVQAIEAQLRAAQQQVIQQPEIAARIESFEAQLREKMTELDPEVPGLLDRMEELGARLSDVMAGQR